MKLKNSDNWGIWKFQRRVLLNLHGALKVALGTNAKPAALAEGANKATRTAYVKSLAAWEKADAMAQKRGKSKRGRGRGGASRVSTKPGKCYVCREAGHWARECLQRKGDDDREGSKGGNSASVKKLHGEGLVSEALTSKSSQQTGTYEAFDTPTPVRIGDGGCIEACGKGSINVNMFDEKNWNENHLIDVLHVSKLKYNLFSVGAALDKGLEMQSTNITCELVKDGRIVAIGVRRGKMYVMQFKVVEPKMSRWRQDPPEALITSTSTLKDWHEKLAHQNFRHVKQILDRFQIPDDYSHYRATYFIESKAETTDCVENFLKKAEKQCPGGVRVLRTDNGLEFVNNEMKQLTNRLGIRHQRTVTYTPEQNGSAERNNRTLKEAGLMLGGGFRAEFWAEAVNTAVNTLNRTGMSSVKGVTPLELWFQRKPDIKDLHIFGEEVFVRVAFNWTRYNWTRCKWTRNFAHGSIGHVSIGHRSFGH
ncbi:retrovirus-related pol polyprotein from transposon tnt 1-94, partial [Lasius niger]